MENMKRCLFHVCLFRLNFWCVFLVEGLWCCVDILVAYALSSNVFSGGLQRWVVMPSEVGAPTPPTSRTP